MVVFCRSPVRAVQHQQEADVGGVCGAVEPDDCPGRAGHRVLAHSSLQDTAWRLVSTLIQFNTSTSDFSN